MSMLEIPRCKKLVVIKHEGEEKEPGVKLTRVEVFVDGGLVFTIAAESVRIEANS